MNYQATHNPYAADVLSPQDQNLIWTSEFGTNVNPSIGDNLNTANGSVDVDAFIDARTGQLQLRTDDVSNGEVKPRGRVFQMPLWAGPNAPLLFPDEPGDTTKAASLFCKFGLVVPSAAQGAGNGSLANAGGVILGPEALQGDTEVTPFWLGELWPAQAADLGLVAPPGWTNPPSHFAFADWADALNPPLDANWAVAPTWGSPIYLHLFMIWSEKDPTTQAEIQVSRDGLHWVDLGGLASPLSDADPAVSCYRRFGLTVRGQAYPALDWARLYQVQIRGTAAEIQNEYGEFIYNTVITGGRRFTR